MLLSTTLDSWATSCPKSIAEHMYQLLEGVLLGCQILGNHLDRTLELGCPAVRGLALAKQQSKPESAGMPEAIRLSYSIPLPVSSQA